jgi:hypothetical protein
MAKMTLLEIVQEIMSDMDSDEVNSINDTVESLQVARVVRSTYENVVTGREYPHKNTLLKLQASGDVSKPTHMKLPENVIELLSINYNKKKLADTKEKYSEVKYLTPEEFILKTNWRDTSATNVTIVEEADVELFILNDTAPTYFTSFDDVWLVFDSYDSVVDDTLQESKTQCFGKVQPTFSLEDDFIPDLPVQLFPYFVNEAKSTAFLIVKQMPNQKAEQHSVSQRRRMSQDAWRLTKGIKRPDYGRRSKKG